jgi:hypothetical protein
VWVHDFRHLLDFDVRWSKEMGFTDQLYSILLKQAFRILRLVRGHLSFRLLWRNLHEDVNKFVLDYRLPWLLPKVKEDYCRCIVRSQVFVEN